MNNLMTTQKMAGIAYGQFSSGGDVSLVHISEYPDGWTPYHTIIDVPTFDLAELDPWWSDYLRPIMKELRASIPGQKSVFAAPPPKTGISADFMGQYGCITATRQYDLKHDRLFIRFDVLARPDAPISPSDI
jgi:hypothetical protein